MPRNNKNFNEGTRKEVYRRINMADQIVTSYDINKAMEILSGRAPDTQVPVEPLVDAITWGRSIDEEHAKTVDSSKPVILASFADRKGKELIDGWHRAWKAHTEGKTHIPAVTLTPEETESIASHKAI
jgi:hypothetical protein